MLDRGQPLSLWGSLWKAIQSLRPAFSNVITFMWFATVVAGMIVRVDQLGVTSIVRCAQPAARTLLRAAQALPQQGGQARPAHRFMGPYGVAAVPKPRACQRSACSGGGRHQDPQAGQEDARGQAVTSAIGIQHQARVYHGAFLAGRRFARSRGCERVRCAACRYPMGI